jgi:hypothetical protein
MHHTLCSLFEVRAGDIRPLQFFEERNSKIGASLGEPEKVPEHSGTLQLAYKVII